MTDINRIARYVSILLVPPTIAAIAFTLLVLAYQHGSPVHRLMVWIVAVLCSGGIQIIYVLHLRRRQTVTDYDVPLQKQRTKPYIVSAIIALTGVFLLWYLNASVFILGLMVCHVTNTLVLTLINTRWKISAHMLGLVGFLPALLPLFGAWIAVSLPFAALLGWARIRLQIHTPSQVIAGGIVGFVLTYVQLFFIFTYVLST